MSIIIDIYVFKMIYFYKINNIIEIYKYKWNIVYTKNSIFQLML